MKFGKRKQTQGAQQAQEPWSETAGNAPRTAGAAAAETAPHGSEGRGGTAFPGLLVLGLALLITCQALLHIMVTVNLIPETGQTLPLISRGGSSTLFTTIALGMILSVSRQNDEQSHDTPRSESIYEK